MGILDLIRQKEWLSGTVTITGLPPHFWLTVAVLCRRVRATTTPPISNVRRYWQVRIKGRDQPEEWPLRFSVRTRKGLYYVGLSVIAFQRQITGRVQRQITG